MARGRPVTPPGTYGEVNAIKISTGRWQANLRVRLLNGQTQQIRKNGTTKAEAVRRAKQAALDAAGVADTDDLTTASTITALVDHYLDHLDRSAGTLEVYRSTARNHITPGIGQLRLNEATAGRLDAFLRALAPSTAKRARSMLSGAFGVAVRYGLVLHNPVRDTLPPKITTPEARALTMEELQTVRRMAQWFTTAPGHGPRPRALPFPNVLDFLAGTGVRISDALRLQWDDLNLDATPPTAVIHDVKGGGRRRIIELPDLAAEAVRSQQRATMQTYSSVFPTGTGKPLTKSNIERWMRQAKEAWDSRPADQKTGEPDVSWVTPHTFRRSVATWLNDRVSLQAASQQLGHSDSTVTEHHYLDRTAKGPEVALVLNGVLECTNNAQKEMATNG
ncbi:tyrosine-type recombinase/integrase [Corynebacterium sp. AOP12-C2-36]|uniref:tyrosine-type recombinase/integrase n=1 Tax=Corynebacterium sp. AOP12-C2-36 TaxID=3457723 RepID=UPI0040336498